MARGSLGFRIFWVVDCLGVKVEGYLGVIWGLYRDVWDLGVKGAVGLVRALDLFFRCRGLGFGASRLQGFLF